MNVAGRHIVIARAGHDAGEEWAASVLGELGLGPDDRQRWRRFGPGLLVAWVDRLEGDALQRVGAVAGVERVLQMNGDERLFRRWPIEGCSTLDLVRGPARDGRALVIAGPCSVESEAHLLEVAAAVTEAGADAIRAGLYKPRTSPYSFGGLGESGLEALARAREQTGLPVVTEVLAPDHLDLVAAHADVLQIGSRNMYNSPLLFQVGAHPSGRPVLLKRGLGSTVDELLYAAEYVLLGRLAAGHDEPRLMLCERGIRTFERSTRFTLDLAAIPVLHQRSYLPVIADPSHAAGSRELVLPLALAALAAGAEGLLVEVHPDPPGAWSDAGHGIDFETFRRLMDGARG